MLPIFTKALPLLEKIEAKGYEAYFVGGSVRDYILSKEVADVDIATSATPQEIKTIFPKTIDVGIEHGTVVVLWESETYEVTTFRSEAEYSDFRRPSEITFIRSLEEDLKRRDFTMNSIAMNRKGELIDPFLGIDDIHHKRIETVGSASERFHEDALRMMRAVRFVSQLSFTIEDKTLLALKENAPLLGKISVERKTAEFEKLLAGENRKLALQILLSTNLYQYLPQLHNENGAIRKLLDLEIERLSVIEIWTLLLYLIDVERENVEDFLRSWKLPVKNIKSIKNILTWLEFRQQSQWSIETLYQAKLHTVMDVETLYNVIHGKPETESLLILRKQYQNLLIKDRQELSVSGHDLMQWEGKKGGLWVKDTLELIEKAVLTGQVTNEKEKIREWLLKWNQQ